VCRSVEGFPIRLAGWKEPIGGTRSEAEMGPPDQIRGSASGARVVAEAKSGQTVGMLLAPFGSTGHQSSRLIFGAAALGSTRQEAADRIIAQVVDAGINHFDTAASYGDSELRLAPFLADHRGSVFLASKTGERSGSAARAELERSLTRLGVDQIDLIQLHNLVEDEEWAVAHGPGGVVEAMARARAEGLVRFIGVTGHGLRIPGMHVRSLAEFPFDSVLFPYNHSLLGLERYRADVEALLALCAERGVATQTIKSVARRRWTDDSERHFSWYEPLSDEGAIDRAVRFVLARPGLFLNTSSDARLLSTIVAAATSPLATVPPVVTDLQADVAAQGIAPLFDGAALDQI
jgi:aryl-alcohol dehydrogenase-like predicted oxidoreductase